jgi:hypothetical protein
MKRFPEQEAGTSLFVLSPTLAANQVGDMMIGRYDRRRLSSIMWVLET